MEVTRIIHPIGQGAFYTERICSKDQIYNVVYDCGSGINKNAPKRLIQEIASVFTSNDVVDILFVSHFDNDHINGIRELKKRVKEIRKLNSSSKCNGIHINNLFKFFVWCEVSKSFTRSII